MTLTLQPTRPWWADLTLWQSGPSRPKPVTHTMEQPTLGQAWPPTEDWCWLLIREELGCGFRGRRQHSDQDVRAWQAECDRALMCFRFYSKRYRELSTWDVERAVARECGVTVGDVRLMLCEAERLETLRLEKVS